MFAQRIKRQKLAESPELAGGKGGLTKSPKALRFSVFQNFLEASWRISIAILYTESNPTLHLGVLNYLFMLLNVGLVANIAK